MFNGLLIQSVDSVSQAVYFTTPAIAAVFEPWLVDATGSTVSFAGTQTFRLSVPAGH